MKNLNLRIQSAMLVFVLGLATGYLFFGTRDESSSVAGNAIAQTTVAGDATTWEYTSVSIDAASIQSKLTAMGFDGWEVFSITSTDATVEDGPEGKPHVTTQRFELTAKRKRR